MGALAALEAAGQPIGFLGGMDMAMIHGLKTALPQGLCTPIRAIVALE